MKTQAVKHWSYDHIKCMAHYTAPAMRLSILAPCQSRHADPPMHSEFKRTLASCTDPAAPKG